MLITRKSQFSGTVRTLDIPVTEAQMAAWQNGMLIQAAMPDLTQSQREFLKTGITDEEWDAIFPPDDEDGEEGYTHD
jgi:hypothetical protein